MTTLTPNDRPSFDALTDALETAAVLAAVLPMLATIAVLLAEVFA